MGFAPYFTKNRFIMAMFALLAAPTNHSLGDVVYKKVSTLRVNPHEEETVAMPGPDTSEKDSKSFRILKIETINSVETALIEGGTENGMLPGTVLRAQRMSQPRSGISEDIPVALLKAFEVRAGYTLAEVVTNGSVDSKIHFGDYPGLMVGDRAVPETATILARTQLLPTVSLTYGRLFVDPKSNPANFELTTEGRRSLIDRTRGFAEVRAPLLMIEAYTDSHGESGANQMESYQRALTVRQTLIEELGIDPERILAIGMGESESIPGAELPGAEDEARRIVIKVKSMPEAH